MTKPFKCLIVSVVIIFELWFLLLPSLYMHGPILDVSYRHQQRVAAFYDNLLHPSPATKAALDAEVIRMNRYLDLKMILTAGILVGIDWLGIYCLRNHGRKKTTT
jgi:hypothetical protein